MVLLLLLLSKSLVSVFSPRSRGRSLRFRPAVFATTAALVALASAPAAVSAVSAAADAAQGYYYDDGNNIPAGNTANRVLVRGFFDAEQELVEVEDVDRYFEDIENEETNDVRREDGATTTVAVDEAAARFLLEEEARLIANPTPAPVSSPRPPFCGIPTGCDGEPTPEPTPEPTSAAPSAAPTVVVVSCEDSTVEFEAKGSDSMRTCASWVADKKTGKRCKKKLKRAYRDGDVRRAKHLCRKTCGQCAAAAS